MSSDIEIDGDRQKQTTPSHHIAPALLAQPAHDDVLEVNAKTVPLAE